MYMTGQDNEKEFIKSLNNKKIIELNEGLRDFILKIFPDVSINNSIIAWKDKLQQKADIYIKIGNYTKGISIKKGEGNSVHVETIQNFKIFLQSLGIPYKVIDIYTKYHYGLKKDVNNRIIGKYTAKEYQEIFQQELYELNKHLNKTKNIILFVERFITKGNQNSNYEISALISGTPDNFVWISKDDIYDLVLSYKNHSFKGPHIGLLTIQPKRRSFSYDSTRNKDIYMVQIKWNNLSQSIIEWNKRKI